MTPVPTDPPEPGIAAAADGFADVREALPAGFQEALRDAQRERWRAEVRRQAALDYLRFFERKSELLEEQLAASRAQAAELNGRLEDMIASRAWQAIVSFWRLKGALRLRRR